MAAAKNRHTFKVLETEVELLFLPGREISGCNVSRGRQGAAFPHTVEDTNKAAPPYLCVLLDGSELQVRMLELLLQDPIRVWF